MEKLVERYLKATKQEISDSEKQTLISTLSAAYANNHDFLKTIIKIEEDSKIENEVIKPLIGKVEFTGTITYAYLCTSKFDGREGYMEITIEVRNDNKVWYAVGIAPKNLLEKYQDAEFDRDSLLGVRVTMTAELSKMKEAGFAWFKKATVVKSEK